MSQRQPPAALTSLSDVSAAGRRLPFRVRPEARQIWLQHTSGTVGALLQSTGAPAAPLGSDAVSARDKLRTNRSQGRLSGGGRQPIRALPINGVTEEALSCSRSSSSVPSFVTSPRSPRRHIDLSQLSGDVSTVEGVHGVRVISPGRPQPPGGDGVARHCSRNGEVITSPGGGIPAPGSEIPLRREPIPSSAKGIAPCGESGGDIPLRTGGRGGSSSPSVGRRQSPPLTDVDRCLPRFANVERTLPPFASSNGSSRAVPTRNGGEGFSSPRTNGGGFSSPGGGGEGIPARVGGTVRLVAPGDTSDRSDGASRRDRIMSLIGNLRRPAGDVDGARAVDEEVREMRQLAGSVTSESPATRFSDESRQSFRELALERARVSYPYRSAPSLAPNRKLKSSGALRDGAAGLAHGKPSTRLLNKRKSQSVTKLTEAPPPPGKLTNKSQSVTRLAAGGEEPAAASSPFRVVPAARSDDRVPPVLLPADDGFASQQPQPSPKLSQSSSDTKTTVDFVRRNRQLASTHCSRRSRSLTRAEPTSENKPPPGTVPRYLVRRQQQWRQAAEERERLVPDPACPPNHTLMADDDRRSTLDVLTQNHQTLLNELRSLPIAHTSSRLVALRSDLEQQLKKVEEGVRIFSMAKVFVKNDT